MAELLAANAARPTLPGGRAVASCKATQRLLVVECDASLRPRDRVARTRRRRSPRRLRSRSSPAAPSMGVFDHARSARRRPALPGHRRPQAASVSTLIEHYLRRPSDRQPHDHRRCRARGRMLVQRLPAATAADGAAWTRAAARRGALARRALHEARQRKSDHLPTTTSVCPRRIPRGSNAAARKNVANALRMIGKAEVESILAEQGLVGVTCEFCNRHYTFVAETRARSSRATAARSSTEGGAMALRSDAFRHARSRRRRATLHDHPFATLVTPKDEPRSRTFRLSGRPRATARCSAISRARIRMSSRRQAPNRLPSSMGRTPMFHHRGTRSPQSRFPPGTTRSSTRTARSSSRASRAKPARSSTC